MKSGEISPKEIDISLLLLRGAALVLLFTFGLQKFERWSLHYIESGRPWGTAPLVGLVRKVGFPFPQILTVFAMLCESVFPFLVALGICSRTFSIFIILSMMGALYTSIRISDPVLADGSAIQYCIIFGAIAIMGPGKYSLGRYLKFSDLFKKKVIKDN